MDVATLQTRAYQTAATKGLRAGLDDLRELGPREQALLALVPVCTALNAIIQEIKRHGVVPATWEWDGITDAPALERLTDSVMQFDETVMRLCRPTAAPLAVAPGDTTPATLMRLLLVQTEVVEAMEVLDPAQAVSPEARRERLACELADILVRVGDLAEGLGINLSHAVTAVMLANDQRPYAYGTPGAREASP